MGLSFLHFLLIFVICMTCCNCSLHTGQEFITAFLQNSNTSPADTKFELTISTFSALTTVKVSWKNGRLIKSLKLSNGESKTIPLPKDIELHGSDIHDSSVLINANHDISVTMVSSKTNSSDRCLVLPVTQLNREYYIVTPGEEPIQNLKEFAVVNYNVPSKVYIYIKGWVLFNGTNFTSNNPLIVDLRPFQVLQLQSPKDLSGTRVLSNNLVAVLSGVTCSSKNGHCGHIYEQLYPVSNWGKQYYVAPIPYQYRYDIIYVTASQYTKINYTSSDKSEIVVIRDGDVLRVQVRYKAPLAIFANASIQVLYYCTGGITDKALFDPFFVELQDTSKFCTKYQVQSFQDMTNAMLITTKTSSISGFIFNKQSLQRVPWKDIPGTAYSFGLSRYGRQKKTNIISHPSSPFALLSVGFSPQSSYGLPGVCLSRNDPCTQLQCRKKESCHIVNGDPACLPDGEALCQIWGDPHYLTFDGHSYDFQGTCAYTVAKTCMDLKSGGDVTLPVFTIVAKYNNQGTRSSSYLASVTIQLDGYNITMVKSEFGFARVNNIKWALPISEDDGRMQITTTGFHALLETDFIRIRYDWDVFLFITIPSSFFENVCGLCGNYNGNKEDDFETPKGVQVSDVVEFGKSWKVNEDCSKCWDDCDGLCPPISPKLEELYKGPDSCGIISQADGPFHQCHQAVSPQIYFKNCLKDMVRNNGFRKVLCEAISVYLVACHMQAVQVKEWRAQVGCELECPDNSKYHPCGDPCPETCAGENSPCMDKRSCMESCECNAGFVLHEGGCIPKNKCGSFCNGHYYYTEEDTIWANNGCTQKCWCEKNTIKCLNTTCQAGEVCAVRDGIRDCYPTSYSQCTAFGDAHYVTFDGVHFDFLGTCKYQLSRLCDKGRGLAEFYIEIFNRNRGVQDISFSRSILVSLYGIEITFSRENKGRVKLNGILYNLPINLYDGHIQIFTYGRDGVILTRFGLKVAFNWDSQVTVTLPASYSGAVCGLCGNFNGNKQDEKMMKSGDLSPSAVVFAQSWRTTDSSEQCQETEYKIFPHLQSLEELQREKQSECGIIVHEEGPFRGCHRLVDPEKYFQDCFNAYCTYSTRQAIYCKIVEAYAAACQALNATLEGWRQSSFCKIWCPENSYYSLCSDGYPKTCSGLSPPSGCIALCRESCVCEEGYLFDVDRCVPVSDCGCVLNGVYYKANEVFYPTKDCTEKCVCEPGGLVKCQPNTCSPFEVCQVENGVRRCYQTEEAQCTVTGGFHYHTFDGLDYEFQSNCSYLLTKSCFKNNSSNSFFFIVSMITPQKITVFLNDIDITINQETRGAIKVNDITYNLPLNQKDKGFWVCQQGISVVLSTDLGLEVTYNMASQIMVTMPSSFHGQVCGLCGNYNGDKNDEFQLPDGSLEKNVTAFATAWKDSSPALPCYSKCQENTCPPCKQNNIYEGKNQCGMLTLPDGAFSACHGHVDPSGYFSTCVLDLCRGQGKTSVLCNSLQSYATMCQSLGVTGIKWRSDGFCSKDCARYSHYENCSNTCINSCARLVEPMPCPNMCSEGCQCNPGYYQDKDKCVSLAKCGCYIKGRYYMFNQNFLTDKCKQMCTCRVGGALLCRSFICLGECSKKTDGSFVCDRGASRRWSP